MLSDLGASITEKAGEEHNQVAAHGRRMVEPAPHAIAARSLGASKLKVLQFSLWRMTSSDAAPVVRFLTRKELLDEVNSQSINPLSVTSPPGSKRQQSSVSALRPRDVRKVDPMFATRLEPAILVRTGCIILSLGRTELRAIITRENLFCVVREGQEKLLSNLQANLTALRASSEPKPPSSEATTTITALDLASSPILTSSGRGDEADMDEYALSEALSANASQASATACKAAVTSGSADAAAAAPSSGFPRSTSHPDRLESRAISSPGSRRASFGGGSGSPVASATGGAGLSFEFCALEAVLKTACDELSRRQSGLSETLQRALLALRRNVVGTRVVAGARQLDHVRQLKQSVRELLVQSQALEELLREVRDEQQTCERITSRMDMPSRHTARPRGISRHPAPPRALPDLAPAVA